MSLFVRAQLNLVVLLVGVRGGRGVMYVWTSPNVGRFLVLSFKKEGDKIYNAMH